MALEGVLWYIEQNRAKVNEGIRLKMSRHHSLEDESASGVRRGEIGELPLLDLQDHGAFDRIS